MKRVLPLLLSICLLLALPACGAPDAAPEEGAAAVAPAPAPAAAGEAPRQSEPDAPRSPVEGVTVAFLPGGVEEPFFSLARAGAQKYAALWGVELLCPEGGDQAAAVQQAMDAGASAVCVAPAAGDAALAAKLREARAAGLAVVSWYSAAPDARSLTVTQGTAETLGPLLVEMGADALRERGVDPDGAVTYLWHTADPDSPEWSNRYESGTAYLKEHYPEWVMAGEPIGSNRDTARAVAAGGSALDAYPDVDLILCDDASALLGQCLAAENRSLTGEDVTITGFCPYEAIRPYLESGLCTRWGLWDCGMQAAMGCYLAAWLSLGSELHAGDIVSIPRIGSVAVLPAGEAAQGAANCGVVPLPEHAVLTAESAAAFDF